MAEFWNEDLPRYGFASWLSRRRVPGAGGGASMRDGGGNAATVQVGGGDGFASRLSRRRVPGAGGGAGMRGRIDSEGRA